MRWSAVWRISLPIRLYFCGCESMLSDLEMLTGPKTFSSLRHLVFSKHLGNASKISTIWCLKCLMKLLPALGRWFDVRGYHRSYLRCWVSRDGWWHLAVGLFLWTISFLGNPAQKIFMHFSMQAFLLHLITDEEDCFAGFYMKKTESTPEPPLLPFERKNK